MTRPSGEAQPRPSETCGYCGRPRPGHVPQCPKYSVQEAELLATITRLRQERLAVLRCVQAALGAVQHGSYGRMRDVVEQELKQALEEAGEIPPRAGVKVETEVPRGR